jgi:hypothetical protein
VPGAAPAAAHGGTPVVEKPVRPRAVRQRDFGIGYGNSSGYGLDRNFLPRRDDPLFRFR